MSEEHRRTYRLDQRAFACHVCNGEKKEIMLRVQLQIIRNGIGKQNMIETFRLNQRRILFRKFRERQVISFYGYRHRVPGIQPAEDINQFERIAPVTATEPVS